jgi:tRNA-dihydrouridine synthase B
MKLPQFESKAFLAPMAGVSNPALRLICRELGAGCVFTEFVNVHTVKAKEKDITKFVEFSDKERPVAVQLFGSDLQRLKQAVKIVEPHFDIIDYNMGCPVPKVTEQMAGAALLEEPELAREIFKTLVQNSKKPISVKMRTGINKPNCFLKIAQIAEEEGVSMLTLHARTLKQGYSGKADWSLIKKLKETVEIPVIGNGDVKTPEDAQRMLKETGCDYVMIGRAAMTNPYLFKQINDYLQTGKYKEISAKEKFKLFFKYLEYAKKFSSIRLANLRMQAINISKGCVGGKKLRGDLISVKNLKDLIDLMQDFYDILE